MKLKKSLWATASVIVLAYTTPAFTNDTDKVVNATGNMFMDTVNRTGFFEWISGGVGYTDKTLNWDITAFSNLRETKDTVTYLQTSYNRQKSVNRLNLGLGYRKLIDTTATPLIVGVNAFFDSKDGTKNILAFKASENFQRFSVGAELKTARFDMAANLYRRIGNNIIDDKKVLQGWDITAKGNIPNYEQLSVGVGTYRFDGVEDTVVRGNKLIAEFTPNAMITVRGTYDKPNGESAQTDISVDFKLAFDKSIQDQLKSAPVSATDAVWHKRYDKVERQYDIKTAEVDSTPALGSTLSDADKTANKISEGDGITEGSAYALQNGEQYDVADFIRNIPDSLKTTAGVIDPNKVTVKAEQVAGDGKKGTDYQLYASDGTSVIRLADITADSQFKDLAGGKTATLKLTYSADGFEDRVVFVKAIASSQIGSVLSDSDKAGNDIKGGDGTTQSNAYTLTNTKTYNVSTFVGTVPNGVTPTVKAERVSGINGTDFQFKNGGTNIGVGAASYTSTLEDKAGAGAAVIKLTYSATDFDDRIVYVKTDIAFVANDLKMANLVVPYGSGSVTVSTADILGKLTVTGSQTQKSDWTIKSLTDTDNNANLTVDGKTLTLSGAITTSTTVTVVFEHDEDEYVDQTRTFELSTGAGTLGGTPTGLSGKWGKTFTVDYKVNTSDTVGDTTVSFDTSADFTFSILPTSDGNKGGKDATTAGIVTGALSGAINNKTGKIDGSKLNKSGKLLVKIVRKAKGGLPELTNYQNITVTKQEIGAGKDITTVPTISLNSGDNKWKTGSTIRFDLKYSNLPGGLNANAFAWGIKSWTGSGTPSIDTDGKIFGAPSAGTVGITMSAKTADEKYSGSFDLAPFTIAKQTVAANTLSVANLDVSFVSGNKVVSAADVLGQLTASSSNRSDWTVKSLRDTDGNGNLTVAGNRKSMTISGAISAGTTIEVVFESAKYTDVTKTFELSTKASQISSANREGSGKWGKTYTTNYKLKTRDGGQDFTTGASGDFTFSIVASQSGFTSTTTGIVADGQTAINSKTGAIDAGKLTKSGTLLIKIVRAKKGSVDAVTEYQNFTVSKQDLARDITKPTVGSSDNTWKNNGGKIPLTFAGLPTGTTFGNYDWTVAAKTVGAPTGRLAVVSDGSGITGATSSGTVVITMNAKSTDTKYTGQAILADFAIAKQTGTGALTMGPVVIPFGASDTSKTVSTATITGKLGVPSAGGLGAKSEWTLKSLVDTDSNSNLAVTDSGKTLTISGAITTSTTVTATFESDKYTDKSATFELSTGAGAMSTGDTRTGLSGKWGKTFTTAADYKLKLTDSVGDTSVTFTKGDTTNAGDYTFTILPNSDGGKGGKDATTAGIVTGALTGAINANTGAIDGSKLNKSGKLLVKIVRKAKGGLPELTDYENITVTKQDSNDHPNFRVSATGITWATASTAVTYTPANLPTGIGTATYALTASGTTAGSTTGGNAITVASSDGKIAKTARSGVVKVKITYAANDKYAQMSRDVDVPINKQTATGTLSMADLIVSYTGGNKTVSTADILGQMTPPTGTQKADWTLKSLADTDSHGNLAIDSGGKSMTISGTIPAGTTVTAVFESVKYQDKSDTFKLSAVTGAITSATPTESGKWGKDFAITYNLKGSDLGQTFKIADGDYTFSIITGGDDGSGKTPTTTGIITGADAINSTTGVIDATKLTKGGTLLVKIVRKAKNTAPKITEYYNFTVAKQDYPLTIDTKYASATEAEKAANRLQTNSKRIDVDNHTVSGSLLSQANLSSGMASNITVTRVTGAFSAGISDVDLTSINGKIIVGSSGVITGSPTQIINRIQTRLRARASVVFVFSGSTPNEALALRIQIPASTDKKYNAFDKTIYMVK